jgi:ABC-2 type transport system ATP-binding protein
VVVSAPVLDACEVTKRYGDRLALAGLSLEVGPGEILGLLGPNGAGKSTFVSIVAGLLRPDSGAVAVCGHDVATAPDLAATHVGLAPQETGLFEVLTVADNLRGFAALRGMRGKARARRIDEIAVALRLTHLLHRNVFGLSGGERRRVHTAIAFLHSPRLLLLDEPTVGSDIETRHALLDVVRAAAGEGAAVLYSTHYLPEIEALGASVSILVAGAVIASGSVPELVARHAQAAVELTFTESPARTTVDRLVAVAQRPVAVDGVTVRVPAASPTALVPALLRELGDGAEQLCGVTLRRADLDAVYLALTGARFEPEEPTLVAAS